VAAVSATRKSGLPPAAGLQAVSTESSCTPPSAGRISDRSEFLEDILFLPVLNG
jgi:hypothetical protein